MTESRTTPKGIFDKKTLDKVGAQEEEWHRSTEGQEAAKKGINTFSGIPTKPVYSPKDVSEIDYDDISFPGQYPYTRGFNPLGYRVRPWKTTHLLGQGSGADTRKRWDFMRGAGVTGAVGKGEEEELAPAMVLCDLPTQHGFDPDAPEARGRVGACGFSLSTTEDFKPLFDGIPLEKVQVTCISANSTMATMAIYLAYARDRGYSPDKLNVRGSNLVYNCCMFDFVSFPPQYTLRIMTEYIYYFVKHMPRCEHTSLQGHNIVEVGATGVQEIALILQLATELTEECAKVRLDPDEVVPGFYHGIGSYIDFFEQIAKIRSLRRLWAKIFKEKFKCKGMESLKCRFRSQSSGSMYSAQEPYNNIVRGTITTLASVLGGAENVYTTPFDEALCLTTEESQRIAVRTQQIIYHETNIPSVVDPLGGSYYVEWLTNEFQNEVLKYLGRIEERGGFFKCWETGWIRKELEESANDRQHRIDRGEIVIVGQNKYRLPEEKGPDIVLPSFESYDSEVEQKRAAEVIEFRSKRDPGRLRSALDRVQEASERVRNDWPNSCGVLMPAMIDAFQAGATLGEIQHGILHKVFGYGYFGV